MLITSWKSSRLLKECFFLLLLNSLIPALSLSQSREPHIRIRRNHSFCIINENNVELIPSGRYRDIWTAYDSSGLYFTVTNFEQKKGVYELGKKEVVPCSYADIRLFGNHGFVTRGDKWAVLSRDFREVSGFLYDEVNYFDERGQSLVRQNTQWMLIDTNGKIIKQLAFNEVYGFSTDDVYKKAGLNKQYGYVDRAFNVIIPFEYEDAGHVNAGVNLFPVKKEGKWGYVNERNQIVVPLVYNYVSSIYKGFGWIKDHKYQTIGLVAADGRILFDDHRYAEIEYGQEGTLICTTKRPMQIAGNFPKGYLDSATLQVLIAPQFEACQPFWNGLAAVKKNGLWGIIDKTGNLVVPCQYEYMDYWAGNYLVSMKDKTGMIDKKGNLLIPVEYEHCSYSGSFATVYKSNRQGLLHYSGKVAVPAIYDEVRPVSDSVFYVVQGNKKFLLYADGRERVVE
jgi:WG containing repeat